MHQKETCTGTVCAVRVGVYVNEYWSALMVRWGKNSERKRNMSVERTYEKWKIRARMLEASLKSPRVSISALESGKDENAEEGRS